MSLVGDIATLIAVGCLLPKAQELAELAHGKPIGLAQGFDAGGRHYVVLRAVRVVSALEICPFYPSVTDRMAALRADRDFLGVGRVLAAYGQVRGLFAITGENLGIALGTIQFRKLSHRFSFRHML